MIIWETGECQYYVKSVKSFETSPGEFCLYVCIFTFPTLSPVLRKQSPSVLLSTKAKTSRKGVAYMQVTTTEFKLNLDKYLKLAQTEDILITKNGKPVAKLINPNISSVDSISGGLIGRVPANLDRHYVRAERLSKYTIAD